MAVTAQKSTQLTNAAATPPVLNEANVSHGKLRLAYFTFTQSGAGDATSTAALCKLPPGRVRILRSACVLATSAFGLSRTLDVGYDAYTDFAGSTVSADPDALVADADVSSAANNSMAAAAGGDPTLYFESRGGVQISAVVAGGTIPDAATIKGYIVYAQE